MNLVSRVVNRVLSAGPDRLDKNLLNWWSAYQDLAVKDYADAVEALRQMERDLKYVQHLDIRRISSDEDVAWDRVFRAAEDPRSNLRGFGLTRDLLNLLRD